jgi:TonB family protein
MHCAGIFILFTSPWNKKSPATYEIFAIQMIDIPKMEIPREPPPPGEKPQARRPQARQEIKPEAAVEKPSRRPAPKVPDFSAEKFRETLSAKIEKPRTENTPSKASERPPVKVEKIESSAAEVNIAPLNLTMPQWYILLVQSAIKENWKTHSVLGRRTTTVSFRIHRNGKIENVILERSSGNTGFDRSVIDAVRATRELPRFPQEIPDAHLDIVIEFKTEG